MNVISHSSGNLNQQEPPPVNNTNDKGYLTEYAQASISHQSDGSYCAKLPWKATHLPLPTNHEICKKRAHSLINRLSLTPQLLQTYNDIIHEQVTRGFIEKVQNTLDIPGKTHYIPHHCVKKKFATTLIWIVYDCSCRQSANHPSLNDCLLTGPHFLNDLCSILLRFFTHKYAISADIEKAFLQITLHEDDRNFTRFYWLNDPSDPMSKLDVYRFKTVLFGAVSSPFILYATLHHHLHQHNSRLSYDMVHNLYVDNILSSCSSEADTIQYYHNARTLLSEACFNLRVWVTNSPQLRAITQQEMTDTGLHHIIPLTKYSMLKKLLAATAYVNRFIQTLCNKVQVSKGPLTVIELDKARMQWIHSCQQEVYWREIKNLSTPNSKRLILVRQLRLFLDKEGFLRCGSRIHNAPWMKHQVPLFTTTKTLFYQTDCSCHPCQVISCRSHQHSYIPPPDILDPNSQTVCQVFVTPLHHVQKAMW